jgi:hypothetical protein
VVLPLRRLTQVDRELEASLGYITISCLKTKRETKEKMYVPSLNKYPNITPFHINGVN